MFNLSDLLQDVCTRSSLTATRLLQRCTPTVPPSSPLRHDAANGTFPAPGSTPNAQLHHNGHGSSFSLNGSNSHAAPAPSPSPHSSSALAAASASTAVAALSLSSSFSLDAIKVSKIAERLCGFKSDGKPLSSRTCSLDGRQYEESFDGEALCKWLCESALADSPRAASYIAMRLVEAQCIRAVSRRFHTRVVNSPNLFYHFCGECAPVLHHRESKREEACKEEWAALGLSVPRVSGWIESACCYLSSKRRTPLVSSQAELYASELVRFLKRRHYVVSTRDALLVGYYALVHGLLERLDGDNAPFKFADTELRRPIQPNGQNAVHAFDATLANKDAVIKINRRWEFVQSFGDDGGMDEHEPQNEEADDLVTAVEFSPDGTMLAIGDKAGRISVVEQVGGFQDAEQSHASGSASLEYAFFTEFQSHEPEFDSLKSAEIGARINAIEWARHSASSINCFTSNDRTIKIWSLPTSRTCRQRYKAKQVASDKGAPRRSLFSSLSMSSVAHADEEEHGTNHQVSARCRASLSGTHTWPIHSLSTSSDGISFLSADDLTCLIWDVEHTQEALSVIDLNDNAAARSTGLDELLTVARFHPHDPTVIAHSSSKGVIRIADLRQACRLNTKCTLTLQAARPRPVNNFDASSLELACSILDLRWSSSSPGSVGQENGGPFILARDFLQCHLYDLRRPSAPIYSTICDPRLLNSLNAAVETEAVFDSFHCAISSDAKWFVSGSYGNLFGLHEVSSTRTNLLKAKDDAREPFSVANFRNNPGAQMSEEKVTRVNKACPLEFSRACLKVAWHPQLDALAVAGLYKLYLYQSIV